MPSALPDFVQPCVRRFRHGAWQDIEETLAEEVAVHIEYDGGTKSLWAWPHDLESLVAGQVLLDCLPPPNTHSGAHKLRRALVRALPAAQGTHTSAVQPFNFAVTLCDVVAKPAPALPAQELAPALSLPTRIRAQELLEHMSAFIRAPGLWDNTGCFHRAALLDLHKGRTIRVAEDIGRHNCIDRLAGYAALHDPDALHPSRFVLLISSRITASLYHKARRAGFCCMVSRSAVTAGSYKAALEDGVSLLGFCRPEDARLTVFADGGKRIF